MAEAPDFSSLLITRERFETFLNTLESVRTEFFSMQHTVFNPTEALLKYFSRDMVDEILKYMSAHEIDYTNVSSLDTGFKKLLTSLGEYKSLKLSTAVDLSEHVIKELYLWVLDNVGNNIILDLRVKPYILGGVELSFNGKYADLTLKKKLVKAAVSI